MTSQQLKKFLKKLNPFGSNSGDEEMRPDLLLPDDYTVILRDLYRAHASALLGSFGQVLESTPPTPEPDAEKREGCLVGKRAWNLCWCNKLDGCHLRSTATDHCWPAPALKAHAVEWADEAGSNWGTFFTGGGTGRWTGIHAFKYDSRYHCHQQLDSYNVTGLVRLWGKVIEHTYGYRAEHCIIDELTLQVPGVMLCFNCGRDEELVIVDNDWQALSQHCRQCARHNDLDSPGTIADAATDLAKRYQCEVTLANPPAADEV